MPVGKGCQAAPVRVMPILMGTGCRNTRHGHMLGLDLAAKRIRNVVPYGQVHAQRQIAFLECFPQVVDLLLLLRCRKHNQVQVRPRGTGPLCAGTEGPGNGARKVSREQRQNRSVFLGGDVNGPRYSHGRPLMVWYKPMASSMKSGTRTRLARAFSPS